MHKNIFSILLSEWLKYFVSSNKDCLKKLPVTSFINDLLQLLLGLQFTVNYWVHLFKRQSHWMDVLNVTENQFAIRVVPSALVSTSGPFVPVSINLRSSIIDRHSSCLVYFVSVAFFLSPSARLRQNNFSKKIRRCEVRKISKLKILIFYRNKIGLVNGFCS